MRAQDVHLPDAERQDKQTQGLPIEGLEVHRIAEIDVLEVSLAEG